MLSAILAFALAIPLGTAAGWAASEAVSQPEEAVAATASQFNPEMIIADSLFYNGNAMTASQIQSFLNGKIGTCTTDRCLNVAVIPYAGRAREVSSTGSGKVVCEAIAAGTYTAAQLIHATQVACGISARVILATLQKEQSLVTSRAPSDWALNHAMGMACPDTAPCDSAFAGLGKQIVSGTRQLKAYWINNFARQPGLHQIQWSPNAACGSTTLNIRNYATAALYNYTPYQPNAAALANLYGTGDGCSSYGNRNFWVYYTDWFGSTQGDQFITTTDGVDYLIAMDSNYELWAYPGNGAQGWRPRVSLGPGWRGITQLVGAGDFDGNGHRDVIGLDEAGKAWLYVGDGRLEYPVRRQLAVDWRSVTRLLYAGDFNNDSRPDLFTVDTAGVLTLWPGDGKGGLGTPQVFSGNWKSTKLLSAVGDLSGDGCPDLVSRASNGDLIVHRGDCASGFLDTRVLGASVGSAVDLHSLGDFSGDGIRDVFSRDSSGILTLHLGRSGGKLSTTSQIDRGWTFLILTGPGDRPGEGGRGVPHAVTPTPSPTPTPTPTTTPKPTPTPTATPKPTPSPTPTPTPTPTTPATGAPSPGVGDVDGDGARDVLGVAGDGRLRIYRGDGAGGFRGDNDLMSSWGAGSKIVPLGDWNGDGRPDVGRITSSGVFAYFPGTGTGYGSAVTLGTNWNGLDVIPALDFDGDGKLDVLVRDSVGDLWLYRGDGAGGWISLLGKKVGSGWGPFRWIAYVGDFDSRRGGDVLAMMPNGDLYLYATTGAGTWHPAQLVGSGWAPFINVFSPGDFDGRPGTDVLARTADGQLWLYPGNGSGRWGTPRLIDRGWHTMKAIG